MMMRTLLVGAAMLALSTPAFAIGTFVAGIDFDVPSGGGATPPSTIYTQPGYMSVPATNAKAFNVTHNGVNFDIDVSNANLGNQNRFRGGNNSGLNNLTPLTTDFIQWYGRNQPGAVEAAVTLTNLMPDTQYEMAFYTYNAGAGQTTHSFYEGASSTSGTFIDTFQTASNQNSASWDPDFDTVLTSDAAGKIEVAVQATTFMSGANIESRLTFDGMSVSQFTGSLTPNFLPGEPVEIMNTNEDPDNAADISVFPGKAGWQGIGGDPNGNNSGNPAPSFGIFGDGTVLDYRFFDSPTDENVSLELETVALGSAGRISTVFATTADNVSSSGIDFLNIFEMTDPGAGFGTGIISPAGPADYTDDTMARLADGAGTIDISGLVKGQIYLLAGGFGGTEQFTLTMTGPGQPPIEVVAGGSWPRPNRVHLHDWAFENPLLAYDTISYAFFHADRDGSAARFGGVILDGEFAAEVPEPATAVLAALGMTGLLRRRRRQA